MSTNVGAIHYDVGLETNKFDSVMSSMSKKLDAVGDKMIGMGKTMTLGVTLPVVTGFALAIKAASDLSETMNKIDVAFKDQASTVKAWGDTSLKSMGLAKGSALDAAALFGDMATSMGLSTSAAADMSMKMVQLGADLASFKNISFAEAQTALAGVFTGETESLKRLGIVMTETNLEAFALSQGITKNIQDMTQAEKVNLRFAYIMSQTANAQGDFARTFSSTANQIRYSKERVKELSAEFGEKLLPITGRVLESFNKLLDKFESLTPKQQDMIIKIAAIAAVIGPLLIVLGSLIKVLAVLAAHPVILVLAAIAAAIYLIHQKTGFLTPVLEWLQQVFTNLVNWFVANKGLFLGLWDQFINYLHTLWGVAKMVADVFMTWFWPSLKALAQTIATQLWPALQTLWESLVRVYNSLEPALTQSLKWFAIILGATLVAAIWTLINVLNIIIKVFATVINVIGDVIGWISNLINWTWNYYNTIGNVISAVINWFNRLPQGVSNAVNGVINWLNHMIAVATGLFASAGSWLYNSGQAIIQGLINGITSMAGRVKDAVQNVLQKARDLLPFSPAKEGPFSGKGWTLYSGQSMMQGLADGIRSMASLPRQEMNNAMGQVNSSMSIYGNVNIGNTQTADYFFNRQMRSSDLVSMGLAGGNS